MTDTGSEGRCLGRFTGHPHSSFHPAPTNCISLAQGHREGLAAVTPMRVVRIRSSCQRVSSTKTQAPRGRGPARVCRLTAVPQVVLGEGAFSTSGPGQWTDCPAGRGGLMALTPRSGPSSQPDTASPRSFLGAPSPTGPFWWPSCRGRNWPLLASILSCGPLDSRGSVAPP